MFVIFVFVVVGSKCFKVMDFEVEGEFIEGVIVKGIFIVVWCGGVFGKFVFSWFRRKD